MQYKWYRAGAALLGDIARTEPSAGELAFWYLGQMGMLVKTGGVTLCFDPVLNDLRNPDGSTRRNYPPPFSGEELTGVDYVVCSHNHADHLNLETLLPLYRANPGAKFIVPAPETGVLTGAGIPADMVIGAKAHQPLTLGGGVALTPIPAAHEAYVTDAQGDYRNLGYLLAADGVRFYHAGDTVLTAQLLEDVKRYGPPDVACLPVNGADLERRSRNIVGNMDCRDAAIFAAQTGADLTIPLHYDMVMGNGEDPLLFAAYMQRCAPGQKFHIMQLGERFLYRK
ncbi:MAG: MBL fold metallo-hydrolase [Clostridiales bacterium]|nr:MBL fold metallo-hydrolase [Clostridiales bacterium]